MMLVQMRDSPIRRMCCACGRAGCGRGRKPRWCRAGNVLEIKRIKWHVRDWGEVLGKRFQPRQTASRDLRGAGSMTSRLPSLRTIASSPGSSNSRGIHTAWLRPFLSLSLQRRGFRLDQLLHALHEDIHRDRAFRLLLAPDADVDLTGFHLFVADYELEGDLLQRMFADLGVHLLVAGVDFDAHSGGLQLFADFVRVRVMLLADGDDDHLHG